MRLRFKKWAVILCAAIVVTWIYQYSVPPLPRGGLPITGPRVKLRDGRYLAYKVRGAKTKEARFKVIFSHGFSSSKDLNIPLSNVRTLSNH